MNLKNCFRRLILLSGILLGLGFHLSMEVSAVEMDDYVVPGQEALREIVEEQEETVVIGGQEEKYEVSMEPNRVSIEYSGKIDDVTGEAVVGSAVNVGEDYFILKRNELAYNARTDSYHILCGDRGAYCNVPSDAVLSKGRSLEFSFDEGVTYEFYFNDEPVEDASRTVFEESGEYLLTICNHAEARERSVRFVILERVVNDFSEYRLPEGFEYTEILLDGEKKTIPYTNYYDFLEEGFYLLRWENSRIHQSFTTEFTMDLTPPVLRLPEVINGAATKQVSFEDLEDGAYIRWIRDSREEGRIEDPSEVLSKHGNYVLRVYDQAGNYTEYTFALEGYFDVNAVLAVLLVLVLFAGGFLYCRRLRHHMRVG